MKRISSLVPALLLAAGCDESAIPSRPSTQPEGDLLTRVYEGPKWPDDVTADPEIANTSYLGFNQPGGREFPCAVTATHAESLATTTGFVVTGPPRETDLYFEFDNQRDGYGRPLVRVFKRSYIESLGISVGGFYGWELCVGRIAHRPLTCEAVLGLVDSIWVSWNHNLSNAVLLSRDVRETESSIILTLHEASLLRGDWGVCDRVYPSVTTYVVGKSTGQVDLTRDELPSVMGRCPDGS
ncbi:MAG TPA: hypothetical protein VKU85_11800 [bacterium]|nr:hypothetical protein [bacterium]